MTPIAIGFVVFMFIAFAVLVGLALKFKGKSHKKNVKSSEASHGPSVFGYSLPFLGALLLAEVAIYWYVGTVEPKWIKLAMISWYVFQLAVWETLTSWFLTSVLGRHEGHDKIDPANLEITRDHVIGTLAALAGITLGLTLLQVLAMDKDWDGAWYRLYHAPVFVVWFLVAAHIKRLTEGSTPSVLIWLGLLPLLPYIYGGWSVQPFTGYTMGGNVAPAWLLWLFPPG